MQHNVSTLEVELREITLAFFASDCQIASSSLRAGVLNGIARLGGIVDVLAKRDATEELTKHVQGIRKVVDRIEAPGEPRLNLKGEMTWL